MRTRRAGRVVRIALGAIVASGLAIPGIAIAGDAPASPAADGPAVSAAPPSRSVRDAIGLPGGAGAPAGGAAQHDTAAAGRTVPAESNVDRFGGADLSVGGAGPARFDAPAELPGRLADPSLRPLWIRGLEAERAGRLREAARVYELIVGRVPDESYTYWRIARNYWRLGESLPAEDEEARITWFELAESWAGRGISIDPECAACMLWKFVAMGRQATTRGLMSAVSDVREMDQLLTRGIALQPGHRDGAGNSTLGNLYYAGAVFYRIVPDWWWLRLFVGVKGDKERSLEYARRAVEISEERVDYRVELGAVLLCVGTTREDPAKVAEGMAVLEAARGLDDYLGTDHLDKAHAAMLMASPGTACGYSRDGFIDVDALEDEARAQR